MDGSKITKREELKQIIKTYKKLNKDCTELEKELNVKPAPKETLYLLNWFAELKRDEILTFTEIQNWANLYRRKLEPFEVEILLNLDNIYRSD